MGALRQRELVRKHRRQTVITVFSVVGMAFTLALASIAYLSREEAVQRRAQAESLLQFMVGDLRGSLEPIGRLDLLEQVGDQAMVYFASVDTDDLSRPELLGQVGVLTQIGEIRLAQLRYVEALESFEQAYARSVTLAERFPGDLELAFQRSQSEYWIGHVAFNAGDLSKAGNWWTAYLNSAQALIDSDPTNPRWQRELGYAYHNLAALALHERNFSAAIGFFEQQLLNLMALVKTDPDNTELRLDLADTNSWLGSIAYDTGQLEDAKRYYRQSTKLMEVLLASDESSAIVRYWRANYMLFEYKIMLVFGETAQAGQWLATALSELEKLIQLDPQNGAWMLTQIRAQTMQLELVSTLGTMSAENRERQAEGMISQLEALKLGESGFASVPLRIVSVSRMLAKARADNGELEMAIAELRAKLPALAQALMIDNEVYRTEVARAWLTLGDLARIADDARTAQDAWGTARAILEDPARNSLSPDVLDPWMRVLVRTGHKTDAAAALEQLNAMGYQPLAPFS